MKNKKIVAVLVTASMATSMVATTAMSASAEEFDTLVQEEVLASSEVTTTGKAIDWTYTEDGETVTRDIDTTYSTTNVNVWKLDLSKKSMADDGVTDVTVKKVADSQNSGSYNYEIAISVTPITKSYSVGSWQLINATCSITGITAYSQDDASTFVASANATGDVYTLTIPESTLLPYVGTFSVGETKYSPENSIKLEFNTNFDKSWLNYIPAMSSPSAFLTFDIQK